MERKWLVVIAFESHCLLTFVLKVMKSIRCRCTTSDDFLAKDYVSNKNDIKVHQPHSFISLIYSHKLQYDVPNKSVAKTASNISLFKNISKRLPDPKNSHSE